jgi:hypothetical protein
MPDNPGMALNAIPGFVVLCYARSGTGTEWQAWFGGMESALVEMLVLLMMQRATRLSG